MAKSKTYELALKIAGKLDSSLKGACKDADESFSELASSAKAAGEIAQKAFTAAATAAAALATASVTTYTQHQKAANNLAASTGAVGEELEQLQGAMETVYQNNFGEDIQDVADAVSIVNRNLKDIPTDQIASATEAALALRDTFEYQTEESTRAAAAIEKNFGTSAVDAFSLIAAGAQNGLDYSGELLDTVSEYSVHFSKLGFSADSMFGLLQSGADSTAWNLNVVGDAIKEFSIKSIDGSDSTVQAFWKLGYNAQTMMKTFANGGEAANEAFFDVLNTLMDMDDSVKRDAIGVSLFGTMWEDLGTEAMTAMANASTAAYDTQGALEQISAVKYDDLGSQWEGIQRQAESLLVVIGEEMAPYLEEGLGYLSTTILPAVAEGMEEILPKVIEGAEWIWENREAISQIVIAVTAAVGTFMALKKASTAVTAVKSIATIFSAGAKKSGVLSTAVKLLGGKFTIIAAVIAALVAACILLYKNWDKVCDWAKKWSAEMQKVGDSINASMAKAWKNISTSAVKAWKAISTSVAKAVSNLVSSFQTKFPLMAAFVSGWWQSIKAAWGNIKAIFENIISFVKNVFSGNWEAAWDNIVNIFGNVFGLIVNLAKAPINGVISAINWIIGKVNGISISLPDWDILGEWAGRTLGFSIPEIPELAVGGVATSATLAMIGEGSEPEAVLPLSRLAALLDEWTGKSAPRGSTVGDGDGMQIVFAPVLNFYGPASREDVEEATRLSFEEFKKMYKRMESEKKRRQFSPA